MNTEPIPLPRSQVLRDLCLLFLVLFACSIPFLSQPFHMDDNFYMDMARNALTNPLYPNDTPYVFDGFSVSDMGSHSHPPLQTYFLAVILWLAGEGPGREWIYHAFDLVYALLAVASMYFLSARLVARPLWPSLALACCPLFMVMQHNLMTDLPNLSFWLASIAAFVWAANGSSGGLYLASSGFLLAAMFTSYHSVVLAPLLGFYHVRKKGRPLGFVALAAPVAVMTLWFVLNSLHYHRFLLSGTADYLRLREWNALGVLGSKFVALLEYQGWLILFPASLLYVFARPEGAPARTGVCRLAVLCLDDRPGVPGIGQGDPGCRADGGRLRPRAHGLAACANAEEVSVALGV
jgi:4-amino-4-deoxy-L-arabinose transferase-like glycosyltransferase